MSCTLPVKSADLPHGDLLLQAHRDISPQHGAAQAAPAIATAANAEDLVIVDGVVQDQEVVKSTHAAIYLA